MEFPMQTVQLTTAFPGGHGSCIMDRFERYGICRRAVAVKREGLLGCLEKQDRWLPFQKSI